MTIVYRTGFGKGRFGARDFGLDGSIFDVSMSSSTVSSTSVGLRVVLKIGLFASTQSTTAPIQATRLRSLSTDSAQLSSTGISDLDVRPALYLAEMHSASVTTTSAKYSRIRSIVASSSVYATMQAKLRKVWETSPDADVDEWLETGIPGGIWRPAPQVGNWS